MERTLGELVQLFKDMEELVEVQAEDVVAIDQTTKRIEREVNKGVEETRVAVKHAKNARRKRWICFIIVSMYYLTNRLNFLALANSI